MYLNCFYTCVTQGYHSLLQQHRDQKEELSDDMDQIEAAEFMKLKKVSPNLVWFVKNDS